MDHQPPTSPSIIQNDLESKIEELQQQVSNVELDFETKKLQDEIAKHKTRRDELLSLLGQGQSYIYRPENYCSQFEALGPAPVPLLKTFGINDLDGALHEKIFKLLPQRDVPNVSLVCKRWKNEIDELYELDEWTVGHMPKLPWFMHGQETRNRYQIRFLDKNYDENTVFRPLMRKCVKCTILELPHYPRLNDEFQFMKFPHLLKELTILCPIEPSYLQYILSTSTRLEKLKFDFEAEFPDILGLASLKNLREIVCKPKNLISNHPFLDCHFPNLERFSMKIDWRNVTSFPGVSLLQFLKLHMELKYLALDYGTAGTDDSLTHFQIPDSLTSEAKPQLPNLVEFKLRSDWSPLWSFLLAHQSNLEVLELGVGNEDNIVLCPYPWILVQPPIINCAETLRVIMLWGLDLSVEGQIRQLDLNLFHSCVQLTNLELSLANISKRRTGEGLKEVLVVGNQLPESLLQLTLYDTWIRSSDLVLIMQKLKNLEKLRLEWVGNSGNLSVNQSVLEEIYRLEKLDYLYIYDFNLTDSEETEKFERSRELVLGLDGRRDGFECDRWSGFEIRIRTKAHHVLSRILQEGQEGGM